ncbi:MAG: T9SS type A sorting domain-containing protein [Stygiobacter sp.]
MLKKVTLIFAVVIMTATLSLAQWKNMGVFPSADAVWKGQVNNAIAVDPDGKIWIGKYGNQTKFALANGDTVKLAKGVYLTYIFNPDGTQASFSPIWHIMGDTMYSTTQRGMRTNIDGNIILSTGWPAMYLIDYKTGKGLKKVLLPSTNGPNGPAVSADGTIFIGTVFSGQRPVEMYDQNFTLKGVAIEKAPGFSRTFEVSKDGNTIYWAGYTTGRVYVYKRADEFSNFELKDSIMIGAHAESFAWRPKTNQLWISGGSNNDKPDPGSGFTIGTWYAYDVVKNKIVDSLKMVFTDPTKPDERPRGLAFSNDGNTAYIAQFGTSNWMCQKLVYTGSAVEKLDEMPVGYELSQNYPNPFNPTTNIKFSLPKEGFVTLRVYNSIGQEVATLVNDFKSAGSYQVDFNASNLSSGVYVYTLSVGNYKISKKMMLMK